MRMPEHLGLCLALGLLKGLESDSIQREREKNKMTCN